MTELISPQHLAITLLCEYQKWACVGSGVTNWEEGHRIVHDLWNALRVCTSPSQVKPYLKNVCHWACENPVMTTFVEEIWVYHTQIKQHEAPVH